MSRLTISVLLLAGGLSAQNGANPFDPAIFKAPPAQYRGHAMWNFNLATLNEKAVISGIQEMAKLNYGGFFIEAGGRPQPGQGVAFLSDEYFRYYKLAIEEAKKQGLEIDPLRRLCLPHRHGRRPDALQVSRSTWPRA